MALSLGKYAVYENVSTSPLLNVIKSPESASVSFIEKRSYADAVKHVTQTKPLQENGAFNGQGSSTYLVQSPESSMDNETEVIPTVPPLLLLRKRTSASACILLKLT